ncbi:MAG: BtaA family protein [Desulfovibrionaceae bacterium]|nr:BtaA family protein [Desulfovibrionaceae bacterium]
MTQASLSLVRDAVHQNPVTSMPGLMERMFSLWFSGFVYNQIWEDPRVDLEAMQLTSESRVLTIASGGCNILHYLLGGAGEVCAVDLNRHHVALSRLKLAAARHLPDHETFFRFFGPTGGTGNLAAYERFIAPHLDADSRRYWAERSLPLGRPRIGIFAGKLYDRARMGQFLRLAALICRAFGKNPARILAAKTPAEREAAFQKELDPFFRNKLVRFMARYSVGVFSLGIPPQQFRALKRECPDGVIEEYRLRVKRLACDFPMDDNYFAWQAFARRYDTDGRQALPEYLKAENFERLKDAAGRARVHQASLDGFLAGQAEASLDRYVLLDSQDWMRGETLVRLWRAIRRTARPGARVIFRTAGALSPLEEALPGELARSFTRDDALSQALCAKDRSAIYGGFHLYRLAD